MGMIKGIDRPAICSLIPNKKSYSLMLDLGANVIVSGSNLFQFALMGFCYYSIINQNTKRTSNYISTTKVSLDPPPLELFTIVLPFFKATLVKPPIVTYVSLPDKINGLKS